MHGCMYIQVVRVHPCNARLEQALLRGKRVRTDCAVCFSERGTLEEEAVVVRGGTGGEEEEEEEVCATRGASPRLIEGELLD